MVPADFCPRQDLLQVWMCTDLMNIAIDIDSGRQVNPPSVDRGTPPTWTLARSTAPSHVAAIAAIIVFIFNSCAAERELEQEGTSSPGSDKPPLIARFHHLRQGSLRRAAAEVTACA
jgi:hypothetical protein